jgi:xylan 1,4-beta-xylosidase
VAELIADSLHESASAFTIRYSLFTIHYSLPCQAFGRFAYFVAAGFDGERSQLPMQLKKIIVAILFIALLSGMSFGQTEQVSIRVDVTKSKGKMKPVWSFFGYDEPNYTYMKDGKKLLSELAALSPAPVYVRTHSLLTTGDGKAALKWGSTNAYTEDESGKPRYDWTIVDKIFDTYLERGMKPLVEIGFMPEALSVKPQPYRHDWGIDKPYGTIFTGWAYPPKDYAKWAELIYQWVRHAVEKYGRAEVESWYWELWNEPDIGYWQGTQEEFIKLYDYTADAVKRALPTAKIGGPHVTGPLGNRTQQILRNFLEHCLRGKNYATGKTGAPLDFVAFHAKGAPRVVEGHVRMSISNQLKAIANGFQIVASFPELRNIPIVIGESDPEGCAACSARLHPQNAYRNGTMYSSYTAAQIARTYELADAAGVNLLGSVTWAFEFEDQPYFDGFRDLATNGIDKPVLNTFRMLGQMGGERLAVESTGAMRLEAIRDTGVRGKAEVNAMASRQERAVSVLVWNYHDDDLPAPAHEVEVLVEGLPAGRLLLHHYRIDAEHSNSYETWKRMGSPQQPSAEQYKQLEKAGQLQLLGSPEWLHTVKGRATLKFNLPRQGVSLLRLTW